MIPNTIPNSVGAYTYGSFMSKYPVTVQKMQLKREAIVRGKGMALEDFEATTALMAASGLAYMAILMNTPILPMGFFFFTLTKYSVNAAIATKP